MLVIAVTGLAVLSAVSAATSAVRAATVVVITLFIAPHGNCLAVDFLVLHGINDKVGLCLRHFHGGVLVVNVDLAEFVASHARRLDQRTQDKVGRHPVLASGVDVYPNGFRSGTLALADRLWHIECAAIGPAQFRTAAIMTGPEGGFSEEEVRLAEEAGMKICSLGPRILRCETAPLCALSAVLYAAGALE